MAKKKKTSGRGKASPITSTETYAQAFTEVVGIIREARQKAFHAVNTTLIDLYWQVGEYLSLRVDDAGWGRAVVRQLADYIRKTDPDSKGFSAQNLWRMKQFYETYREREKLSPLVRELLWSHNLLILGKTKSDEEKEFYLRLAIKERWSKRELERQIDGALFERSVVSPPKLSPMVREIHPDAENIFKDVYLVNFLDIPESHTETDLQKGLVTNLKKFLLELGRDFCFIGEEFQVQVGGKDF
jgi:predicted nuclease of restriction endonuclease-like (RecB) superfamily